MFDLDRWQEIYETLRKNKMRTFLTAFGVFWGIFMLVVLMGAGNGLRNGVNDSMKGFATNSIFIWPQGTTVPYKGLPRGRNFSLTNDDVAALRNNVPELEYLAPKLGGDGGSGDNVLYGLKSGKFSVSGDVPDWCKIDPIIIVYGRSLNEKDVTDSRKVVVIGNRVQEVLFAKNENPVGKYIRIKGIWFQVVGSFKPQNQNINIGGDKQQSVFIPITTMQKAYNYGDNIGFLALTTKKGNSAAVVGEKVISMLKRRHDVAPNDKDAIGHFNLEELFDQVTGLFTGIDVLVWVVGTGTLLAGVIGISNIMLVIVKERTKEIGIQRAIGAPPIVIMSQIITESVVLTSIAGFFGLCLGVGLLSLLNMVMSEQKGGGFKDPQVDFNMAIMALGILIVSGAFAGLLPALRAIKVRPIDALRYE
jgi:putative ABC transport system permease protein